MRSDMSEELDYTEFRGAGPGDNVTAQVMWLAQVQLAAEAEVERLQEELQKAQKRLLHIREHQLPRLMDEAGVDKLCKDGIEVTVREEVRGSIPAANADKAFEWLESHGHGGIVKREFRISFSKDEESWARKFMADLRKRKRQLSCEIKRAVHPSTLKSFITEQLAEGVEIPMELLGVYRQRLARIKVRE
jgi:hypothetical protein